MAILAQSNYSHSLLNLLVPLGQLLQLAEPAASVGVGMALQPVLRTWFRWQEVEEIADDFILLPHDILVRDTEPKYAENYKDHFYKVTLESIQEAENAKARAAASRSSSVWADDGLSSAPAQTKSGGKSGGGASSSGKYPMQRGEKKMSQI